VGFAGALVALLAVATRCSVRKVAAGRWARQAPPPGPLSAGGGYACSLNCSLQHASVWATLLGLRPPPASPAGAKLNALASVCE